MLEKRLWSWHQGFDGRTVLIDMRGRQERRKKKTKTEEGGIHYQMRR